MSNGKNFTHKDLDAWKLAIELTLDIYKVTKSFPREELCGLVSQRRRCAVSIPSNLAEGCARQTSKETIQFLHICLGSIAELETQLIISNELSYFKNFDTCVDKLTQIRKMVLGLIKYHLKK